MQEFESFEYARGLVVDHLMRSFQPQQTVYEFVDWVRRDGLRDMPLRLQHFVKDRMGWTRYERLAREVWFVESEHHLFPEWCECDDCNPE